MNLSSSRYCNVTLSRRNRLIQHERLHFIDDPSKLYQCALCGRQFNQKFGIIPHFTKFHFWRAGPTEKWKCAICPDKVLPPGNMAVHYQKEHRQFAPKDVFSRRRVKATEVKCDANRAARKPKSKKQKVVASFVPCKLCGRNFSNYYRYHKHLKDNHKISDQQIEEEYQLPESESTVVKREVFESIAASPEKIAVSKKVPCTTCGKQFASIMTCKAHEKTHLDIRYQCDICGNEFKVKAYLAAHVQKVHLKLRKFSCTFCSASFVHRELLNYHVRKHLNIRNFACKYCSKTFMTNNCRKVHERIHTDSRPFSCRYCDRTFIHHSDHRRHEQRHQTAGYQLEPKEAGFAQY